MRTLLTQGHNALAYSLKVGMPSPRIAKNLQMCKHKCFLSINKLSNCNLPYTSKVVQNLIHETTVQNMWLKELNELVLQVMQEWDSECVFTFNWLKAIGCGWFYTLWAFLHAYFLLDNWEDPYLQHQASEYLQFWCNEVPYWSLSNSEMNCFNWGSQTQVTTQFSTGWKWRICNSTERKSEI